VVCAEELITSFKDLLVRAVGEVVSVKIIPAPAVWFCRTDPHQLETAILNLAINARDAMPQGGILTLSTSIRQLDETTAAALGTSSGDYIVISVADTGIGILPEVITRVFEPFFTTKEVGRGTGLGLSQVYGFARQSGGFVTLESELLHGTAALVHLPRADPPHAAAQSGPARDTGVKGRGVVLVVEDDSDVRAITCGMLQDLGYSVRQADAASKALALVEEGEPIDLVFSDVIMPGGMNGIELVKELKIRRPELPVLLTSGYTARNFAAAAAVDDLPLLRKPYTMADLSKAIQHALVCRS
jgi:CheY-like chemotaxis protein